METPEITCILSHVFGNCSWPVKNIKEKKYNQVYAS